MLVNRIPIIRNLYRIRWWTLSDWQLLLTWYSGQLCHQLRRKTIFCLLFQSWTDQFLTWNPAEYQNASEIFLPAAEIWTPELSLLYRWAMRFQLIFVSLPLGLCQNDIFLFLPRPSWVNWFCSKNLKTLRLNIMNWRKFASVTCYFSRKISHLALKPMWA